jgi:hypothetical protein
MTSTPSTANDRRHERNREIARLVALGTPQRTIRELTGTSERTVRRLLQDEGFRRLVHRARRERADELNAKIPELMNTALTQLAWLMEHSDSEPTRLGAIRTVLGLSSRLEAEEFADRLDHLEQAINVENGWTADYVADEDPDDDDLDG